MPRKSQCPYCSKRYVYSTAYRNHILRSYPGLRVDFGASPPPGPDDTEHRQVDNSAHELDEGLDQLNQCRGLEDAVADSDIESHSESTESHQDAGLPESTAYEGAGAPLYRIDHPLTAEGDPFSPFETPLDFNLARWFIETRTPKEHVQRFFRDGLGPHDCTIKSAYTLFETVDKMRWGLGTSSWKTGTADFGSHAPDDEDSLSENRADLLRTGKQTRFYYQDPVECVRFLLGQPCFAKDMVFAPITEWSGDIPKRPVYSEMHTAEWWWETQVCVTNCSGSNTCVR